MPREARSAFGLLLLCVVQGMGFEGDVSYFVICFSTCGKTVVAGILPFVLGVCRVGQGGLLDSHRAGGVCCSWLLWIYVALLRAHRYGAGALVKLDVGYMGVS